MTPTDQAIGTGDGDDRDVPAREDLRRGLRALSRPIVKPVAGSVRVAVAGVEATEGTAFTCDPTTGVVTFLAGHVPAAARR